ncbi:MAG: ATP-binding protein [Clostridia bacterium]|nr:ATP-binding protein [Clostridia bacterium]
MLIERNNYLNKLINFKDKQLIKVITGIRRCGKSTLFDLYIMYLKDNGVDENQIIKINLENPDYSHLDDYKKLYDFIKEKLQDNKMNYIFIDEVQNVKDFQRAVDGLFIKENCDVYITGSNAFILSSELGTLLSGRYVEIKMLPLSFKEFMSANNDKTDLIIKYNKYIENGSFPYCLNLERKEDIRTYYEGLYNSIIVKDIAKRYSISNYDQLERVISYMFDVVGNLSSTTNIANTLTSAGRNISVHTVDNYVRALTESYVLYKASRYDIKGKEILSSGAKYYLSDIGLRYYLLGTKKADKGHILENVVYLELIRRGYEVYVGKYDTKEVDFIAINENGVEYFQVAYTLQGYSSNGSPIFDREIAPLENIKDHNAKYLLTMDFEPLTSHNGIQQINVLDWLLSK